MKRILILFGGLIVMTILANLIDTTAEAKNYKTYTSICETDNEYTASLTLMNGATTDLGDVIYVGQPLSNICITGSIKYDDKTYGSAFKWENSDYVIVEGTQNVNITSIINKKTLVFSIDITGTINQGSPIVKILNPSINVTILYLTDVGLNYNLNVVDNVINATYNWTSDNISVATVNASNGIVKAISNGTANISCEITLQNDRIITLISTVNVGNSDNLPYLTEPQLNLEIDKIFDLNVKNKLDDSSYRWATADASVITINKYNGKGVAKNIGTTFVTCTITTLNGEAVVIKCNAVVK